MKEYDNLDQYFNDLINDMEKYIRNTAKYATQEIRDELAETAYKAIDEFYDDYEPVEYYRNFHNFKKFPREASRFVKKIHYDIRGYYYVGGIEISNERMIDYYSHEVKSGPKEGETVGTLDQVYYSVVEGGYHGLPAVGTPRMETPPLQMILNKQQEIKKNIHKYISRAQTKARADEYHVLFTE